MFSALYTPLLIILWITNFGVTVPLKLCHAVSSKLDSFQYESDSVFEFKRFVTLKTFIYLVSGVRQCVSL